jgi:hypothetical protein
VREPSWHHPPTPRRLPTQREPSIHHHRYVLAVVAMLLSMGKVGAVDLGTFKRSPTISAWCFRSTVSVVVCTFQCNCGCMQSVSPCGLPGIVLWCAVPVHGPPVSSGAPPPLAPFPGQWTTGGVTASLHTLVTPRRDLKASFSEHATFIRLASSATYNVCVVACFFVGLDRSFRKNTITYSGCTYVQGLGGRVTRERSEVWGKMGQHTRLGPTWSVPLGARQLAFFLDIIP